jgi:large subunit ribosomal protein L6
LPDGVEVDISGQDVTVKGKLGVLNRTLVDEVEVVREDDRIVVRPRSNERRAQAMWGLSRSLVSNMVVGVSEGFSRKLEINGVGYRAAADGGLLNLQLGYSHEIKFAIPDGITVTCERPTAITVSGSDRQRVGQVAADIRALRKPEPYKGKGIKYAEEHIFRKEGKKK